ncbi:glycosyltransferase [Streptacidiphilus melanogenes]|uniref:glycosyltransferase n=1 Tax=Streptacidiphilus melanogenes TaxID=411235 RepID=UPI000AA40B27|nr:galactosyltransferase-related protein [Streptacidiphilus melanogenes]
MAVLIADALVIHADLGARHANPYYWYRLQPVTESIARLAADEYAAPWAPAARRLLQAPTVPEHHRRLVDVLTTMVARFPARMGELADLAWQATHQGRLGHHLGADVAAGSRGTLPPGTRIPARRRDAAAGPTAQVVIPFRDRGDAGHRLRNLLSCLNSLRDQDPVDGGFTVTVVEADDSPRWRAEIEPLADEYLFVRHSGPFNKAWVVNVGVVQSASRAGTLCVFDADLLPDRGFVARNVDRFRRQAGAGAVLPYRDMLYLDEESSELAIGTRCLDDAPALDPRALRGFWVRRPVGGCVWLRRDVFDRIRGMDERYEGWGGEDVDLVLRLQSSTALYTFDDFMVHLHHPVVLRRPDETAQNDEIPYMTWNPTEPIGQADRYATPVATATGPGTEGPGKSLTGDRMMV